MFCTESCEHGINATSSGRVLGQSGSLVRMQRDPVQMGQLGQLRQTSCQQPSCSMGYVPVSAPNLWLASDLESPRLGMCFVTERPEGLSIDCRVPIPSNFNVDENQRWMLKPSDSAPDNDFGLLLMQSALPPCVGFAKEAARSEKPSPACSPCFPFQDICAAEPKPKHCLQQSCRMCQQVEQQELQRQQQQEELEQAEQPKEQAQPLPQQQQLQPTEKTCRGVPSSLDDQLMGYLESIVEIMLAKKLSSLQNQGEQPGQSSMGVFGLEPLQQLQQNDQQHFDPSISNSPKLVPPCACGGILPASVQTAPVRLPATTSQPTGSPNSCSDMETQTTFNLCSTCPTRSHVWHRPRCSHCFWYPTKIQR